MKKIISIFLLTIFIFSLLNINIVNGYTFVQSSLRQNSSAVATNDPVTATKWNSMVQDITNIIQDIGSLKLYIDFNITPMFIETSSRLEQLTHDIRIGRNMEVIETITGNTLNVPEGGIRSGTILTNNIKNNTIRLADLHPNIQLGGEKIFEKNGTSAFYSGGNVAIGQTTADQRLVIEGDLEIKTPMRGIIFPDGTFQTTRVSNTNDNVLLTGDQEISGNKKFLNFITLSNTGIQINRINDVITNENANNNSIVTEKAINEYLLNIASRENAICGLSHNSQIEYGETPTNLCFRGNLKSGGPTQVGAIWNWECEGINGGTNDICNATEKEPPIIYGIENATEMVNKARYVRDYLNGSTANTGNHWVEIQVLNTTFQNIALNRPITHNGTGVPADRPLSRITDGISNNTDLRTSISNGNNEEAVYVEIDLGSIQTIHSVRVWHYYGDGRRYNRTRTEISEDGINWIAIADSNQSGTYAESQHGRTVSPPNTAISFKRWEDGTYAKSCKEYRDGVSNNKRYIGAIGNGIYRIMPDPNTGEYADVFCDMDTDGGGWTLTIAAVKNSPNNEFSWSNRQSMLTSSTIRHFGNFSNFNPSMQVWTRNYKSLAYHILPFNDIMITVSNFSTRSHGIYNIGGNNINLAHFIENHPVKVGHPHNNGYPMASGTFTTQASGAGLCNTNLYFNTPDLDMEASNISLANANGFGYRQYDNSGYGPAFSQLRNNGTTCISGYTDEPGWTWGMSNEDNTLQRTFWNDGGGTLQYRGLHTSHNNINSISMRVR